MKYSLGRAFQLVALISMPSAIWAAEYLKSEPISIAIFAGSIVFFTIGYFLSKSRS